MTPTIAVVGSMNTDLSLQVDRLPLRGETVMGSSVGAIGFGGKGANQAAAATTLGGKVTMVGCVGRDQAGDDMIGDLVGRGVNVEHIERTETTHSGGATICVDPSGENLIIVDPGANFSLSDSAARSDAVGSADVVLAQLEVPLPVIKAALTNARGTVILNPAPYQDLDDAILDKVDILVPNRLEMASLVGGALARDVESVARTLESLKFHCGVVVTLGAEGALVKDKNSTDVFHVRAPKTTVVDTTGAGDCFCGALALAIGKRQSLVEAVKFAVVAASISTTGVGARGHLPTLAEVVDKMSSCEPEVDKVSRY